MKTKQLIITLILIALSLFSTRISASVEDEFANTRGVKKGDLNKTGERGKYSSALRSKKFWTSEYKDTDLYGFSALPAGYFNHNSKDFTGRRAIAVFWSGIDENDQVWCRSLKYDSKKIERSYRPLPNGFSVRCVKD